MIKQFFIFIISVCTAWGVMYSLAMPDLWFWMFCFFSAYMMFVFSSEKKNIVDGIRKTTVTKALIIAFLSGFIVWGDELLSGIVRLVIMSSFLISFFNITGRFFSRYLNSGAGDY